MSNKYNMKVSNTVIEAISNRKTILALALSLGFTEQWTRRIIEQNKYNGPLTTKAALETIQKELGLTEDQILEREPAPAA